MIRMLLMLMLTRRFWYLFIASFTLVMMMAWRSALRDQIFKGMAAKFDRRYVA